MRLFPGSFPPSPALHPLVIFPVTTGVRFRGINDTGPRSEKIHLLGPAFRRRLRGEMGEIADYFKTWNWEMGFRYSRNEGQDLSIGEVSQPGLRDALLDTDPATAFRSVPEFQRPQHGTGQATSFMLPCTTPASTSCLSITQRLTATCSTFPPGLFPLPSAASTTRRDFTRDRDVLNTTFQSIGSVDGPKLPCEPGCVGNL